jgi:hypothetical protein
MLVVPALINESNLNLEANKLDVSLIEANLPVTFG